MQLRWVGFAGAVTLLGLILAWALLASGDSGRETDVAYWVGEMIIEHLREHEMAWPRGWDDLRGPHRTLIADWGEAWKFEELSALVEVDWEADPRRLIRASAGLEGPPPFRAVRLKSGAESPLPHREPNRRILDFLVQNWRE